MLKSARLVTRRVLLGDAALPAELHPVLARVYQGRQVRSTAELDRSLERLLPPSLLKGIDAASALLEEALHRRERILIVADFDADGATSCAVMLRALRALGAADVRYVVPDRFRFGYGLTPAIVEIAAQQQPWLLITVDNGISSLEGVAAAQRQGIRVLITDHHLPGHELPAAEAIVNPNQPHDEFPSKVIAGVGVAFYVMLALRARLRARGWFAEQSIPEPNLAKLLDLVALGTVADVVPLDHNNRILVAQGLARLQAGQGVEGIRALLRVAGRREAAVSATDLGFFVAPRLNAAGRLEDMALGIECLLTDDPARAQALAQQLDSLNRERRQIEAGMNEQAFKVVESLTLEAAGMPRGLCLFDEGWHQGVIGLVASRVKERTHRPVIAFAPATGDELKGSARSIPNLHIRDTLDTIAARHPQLVSKFGGHAMAAGLSLKRSQYDAFREAFAEEAARQLTDDDLQGVLHSDGALEPTDFTMELAELLHAGGPWGQGFPEPLFDNEFEVLDRRVVGEKHLKLQLKPGAQCEPVSAIAFGAGSLDASARLRAAYRLTVNEYQGQRTLQLVLEHVEPVK